MAKIGDLTATNFRVQSARTKEKLSENTENAVTDILKIVGVPLSLDVHEKLAFLIYSSLTWTADDVLAQAVDDGYKSTS